MDSNLIDNLQAPRFATGKPLLVAGIGERYSCENGAGIPGQWQRFHQLVDTIPGRIGKVAYGVCCNGDDAGNFDYIAGEIPDRYGWFTPVYAERSAAIPKPALVAG